MAFVISEKLEVIKKNIQQACENSNRKVEDIKLIAVSKKQTTETMHQALSVGLNNFGENYVQEFLEKQKLFLDDVQWHFIGHLQSNKAKSVAPMLHMLHSLDSLNLAKKLNSVLTKPLRTLVQVNVSGEASKDGVLPKDLTAFLKQLEGFEHIQICGLMTMPPWSEKAEDSRMYFNKLKILLDQHSLELSKPEFFKELSMGTSQDYQVAVEEGATYIRLGSVLLGERS